MPDNLEAHLGSNLQQFIGLPAVDVKSAVAKELEQLLNKLGGPRALPKATVTSTPEDLANGYLSCEVTIGLTPGIAAAMMPDTLRKIDGLRLSPLRTIAELARKLPCDLENAAKMHAILHPALIHITIRMGPP